MKATKKTKVKKGSSRANSTGATTMLPSPVAVPTRRRLTRAAFKTKAARLHDPKNMAANAEAMKQCARLLMRAQRPGEERPDLISRLIEESMALAYYSGIREGFRLGKRFERGSIETHDEVLQFLRNHRNLFRTGARTISTNKDLAEALDAKGLEVPNRTAWGKRALKETKTRRWGDALVNKATANAVQVYFNRRRQQADRMRLADQWEKIFKREKKLKRKV